MLIKVLILSVLIVSPAMAGLKNLFMNDFVEPPRGYKCDLKEPELQLRKHQKFKKFRGDYDRNNGCTVNLNPQLFYQSYKMCFLSGIKVDSTKAPSKTDCSVKEIGGLWSFKAYIDKDHEDLKGGISCSFLCID
jgi:hypothetical protein